MKKVAGTLKLDQAQFRELEAFAKFGSDLDAATMAVLEKGKRNVEILKQAQNDPFTVEDQVAIIYAGSKNLLRDVPVEKVVSACKEHRPVMVTGTALMTTTMTAFPKIAHQLKAAGLNIPFICGGGAVCEEYVTGYDLGIWGKEASQAPGMAEDATAGESWESMRGKWNG